MSLSKEPANWEKNLDEAIAKRKESMAAKKKSKRVLRVPSEDEEERSVKFSDNHVDISEDTFAHFPPSPPKKKKRVLVDSSNEPVAFNLGQAIFDAPISFQEEVEESVEDQIPCGLCNTPLKVGVSAAGKEYMMCVNSDS